MILDYFSIILTKEAQKIPLSIDSQIYKYTFKTIINNKNFYIGFISIVIQTKCIYFYVHLDFNKMDIK